MSANTFWRCAGKCAVFLVALLALTFAAAVIERLTGANMLFVAGWWSCLIYTALGRKPGETAAS
jgi:hypothetical protein